MVDTTGDAVEAVVLVLQVACGGCRAEAAEDVLQLTGGLVVVLLGFEAVADDAGGERPAGIPSGGPPEGDLARAALE